MHSGQTGASVSAEELLSFFEVHGTHWSYFFVSVFLWNPLGPFLQGVFSPIYMKS